MADQSQRSLGWGEDKGARYWWHSLSGMDYVPPVYSELAADEWAVLDAWFRATDASGPIGECTVPMISFLHGIIMGNRISRIVQLGTCAGYSALLLGFMLRRMKISRALYSLDIDGAICEVAREWISRAGLQDFVEIAEGNSTAPESTQHARDYLRGSPELIIIDSSHEYRGTMAELDLWYPEVAPGGLIVLHDVSRFAESFDVTHAGGVRRAFDEWRSANQTVETFLLNGEARSMAGPRPLYKDACGLGLIHKPM